MQNIKIGGIIPVHACKTDGTVYRSWRAAVESVSSNLLITVAPAGSSVLNIKGEDYPILHHYRAYYWFDKFYNLLEVFEPDGRLIHIYINIASPPEFRNGVMSFKDHELDVSKVLPNPAKLVDEDEFAEAAVKYGYTPQFQEEMYAVAREALATADAWTARPCPVFRQEGGLAK